MGAIGLFGARILGKKKFEQEQKTLKEKSHIYGPKVINKLNPDFTKKGRAAKVLAERQKLEDQEVAEDRQDFDASLEVQENQEQAEAPQPQAPEPEAIDAEAEADTDGNGYLSEAEVVECLKEQPELAPRLAELELKRSPKPRKGVSRILASHLGSVEGHDADLVAALTAAAE